MNAAWMNHSLQHSKLPFWTFLVYTGYFHSLEWWLALVCLTSQFEAFSALQSEKKYQSHCHSSISNASNWLLTISPKSQIMKITANDQNIVTNVIITSNTIEVALRSDFSKKTYHFINKLIKDKRKRVTQLIVTGTWEDCSRLLKVSTRKCQWSLNHKCHWTHWQI